MSRNPKQDFTQYVHEYKTKNGKTLYAVGVWNQESGQYTCPMDSRTAKLTGCFAYFSRTPSGLGGGAGYKTKKEALRRARYLFAPDEFGLTYEM
jgi:hypothetical protein